MAVLHPSPVPAPGLSSRLRLATRAIHEQVDGAFPQGLASLDAYVRYLRAVLPLVRWLHDSWQPAWAGYADWHEPAHLHRLTADLAHLGAAPRGMSVHPPARPAAEWLGGCYVLEGSALGAKLLVRDLARLEPHHPRIAAARSFIDGHVADSGRWPRFRRLLDSLPETQAAAALRGAHRGFALVDTRTTAMEATA